MGVFLQPAAYLEARALLHPLPGLHRSVSVQVGTEVAMSAHPHFILEAAQQLCHEQAECRALFRCAGVFRISRSVQSAFVADAYRMLVVALHMRPHKLDGAGVGDGTVTNTRPIELVGAHVKGYNKHSIGICYEGGLDASGNPKDTRTPEQRSALRLLVAQLLRRFKDEVRVCGHRDLSPDLNGDGTVEPREWVKQCPCFEVSRGL